MQMRNIDLDKKKVIKKYYKNSLYKKYFKRLLDFSLSLISIIVLIPAFLIVALVIKLDSVGSVFFVQERLGKNGKVFKIIKFRTMIVGAENIGTGLFIKSAIDSRITRVGSFLRKTSLDEIPQLINVLKGDMSIVGPRPPVTCFPYKGYNSYPQWAKKRFDMRPGITGLAQVIYRTNAEWDERIKLDIKYIDNATFITDVKLIISTVFKIIKREDIYREALLNKKDINKAHRT